MVDIPPALTAGVKVIVETPLLKMGPEKFLVLNVVH